MTDRSSATADFHTYPGATDGETGRESAFKKFWIVTFELCSGLNYAEFVASADV
jgi:hypothetical protein